MQWKWQYEYPEAGVKFISTLATPRDQISQCRGQGRTLSARGRQARRPAGRQEGAHPADLDRRHPHLVGTAVRRQARRRARFPPRDLGLDRKAGHLSRPVRRTVRQGPRLHAGRRPRRARAGIPGLAGNPEGRGQGRRRRCRPDLEPRRTDGQGQGGLREAPARPATSRNGQGLPPAFPALAGSQDRQWVRCSTRTARSSRTATSTASCTARPARPCRRSAPRLSDVELAAVITYERNSFGNRQGDMIQPAQIKTLR
jgi:cytochrome c oxidase subunit 2